MKQILLSLLLCICFNGIAQDTSDSMRFEAGVSLNRYVPDRDNEVRPYFYAATFRYNWKSTEKMDHFISIRVAGNYNKQVSFKPLVAKRYLSFEAGYHARWRKDDSKWRFGWGVNAGIFQVNEKVTPLNLIPFLQPQADEPFNRNRYKLAISPEVSVEYYLNPLTYVQIALSMSVGTHYIGEVDHLPSNTWRGFSAQAPSIGIYRRF